MSKIEELKYVVELFRINNIDSWIDSGTLLGLYRDGKIMDHDEDIDISMWSEDENKLRNIIITLKSKGYKLRILNYNNYNFKYKFIPNHNENSLIIDVNLFLRSKELSLCPQPVHRNGYFIKIFLRPYLMIFKSFFKMVRFDNFPNNRFFRMYTWTIPTDFFSAFSMLPNTNIPTPAKVNDYLEFRYGNWEIPQKNWSFVKDDEGLKHIDIKEIVKTSKP